MCPAFIRLSPCRKQLCIEAERIEAEYNAAKRKCDEAPRTSQTVLATLDRVGSIHADEVREHLEKELGTIPERACELIKQTIAKSLEGNDMSVEDLDVGRTATIGKKGVSVVQCLGWATNTELVTRSCSLAWELEISGVNPPLRKLE